MNKYIVFTLLLTLISLRLDALIVFNGENNATTSAPESVDLPWDANARVANFNGSSASSPAGSAVHLGFGYMLTANHVANRSHVSFDGVTWYARDTGFTPVQVATGVDLKVFRLQETPAVSAVTLHSGGGEVNTLGYHVSWGRGRANDSEIGQDVQQFSTSDATIDKRWGSNVTKAAQQKSWTLGSTNYSQDALITVLGNSEGANEAALTTYDSGSGYYQEHNGSIVLAGIAAAISMQNSGSATFGDDSLTGGNPNVIKGDQNFLIQIGPYANDIMAVIPEPRFYGLMTGMLVFGLLILRRKR